MEKRMKQGYQKHATISIKIFALFMMFRLFYKVLLDIMSNFKAGFGCPIMLQNRSKWLPLAICRFARLNEQRGLNHAYPVYPQNNFCYD
jgi:hypothetical protein